MPNPNYNSLVTTTIESRGRVLADNVSKSNALLMRLRERGNKKIVSGGSKIVQPIDFLETPNTGWYSGYDLLTTVPTDTATSAEFPMKECYASVIISGQEQAANQGKEAFIDLLESKVKNAERTMMNLLGTGVYSDGSGASGKQIGGLQLLVSKTPATGTVGGINRATDTWWRNLSQRSSTNFGAASTSANILNHMGRTWNQLVRGNDKPDLIPSDVISWQLFLDAMSDRQIITNAKMAEAGFENAKFRGADVFLEATPPGLGSSGIPTNTMYFLNTDYLFYRPYANHDIYRVGSDREPVNQDAIIKIWGWKGNLTMSGAAFQGVLQID